MVYTNKQTNKQTDRQTNKHFFDEKTALLDPLSPATALALLSTLPDVFQDMFVYHR